MKPVVLCALFAPIIYLAFRQKKWYLYLLFAFIGVLPEQFSFKLHESLPLLTVTRILIIIVVGFWMYDKWKTKKFQIPVSLILYFAVNLIISLINLRYGSQEIKRIFLLIFERVLLVIMIADMIHDKEEFNRCIDFAIMGCTALAVIGIIQTTFDYDISTVLHLVKTPTSIQLAKRMGLIRAFGTYNAISFGCYCAFMSLLILYRLYNTKSIWHHIAFSLTLAALICTFTRSAWLCIGAIAFLILVLFRLKLIKRVLPSVGMLIALFLILSCFRPALGQAFIETGKSSINTILKVLPDEFAEMLLPNESEDPTNPTQLEGTEPPQTEVPTDPTETEPEETAPSDPDATEPKPTLPSTSPLQPPPPSYVKPTPSDSSHGFKLDKNFGLNANDPTYSRNAQWTALAYMKAEGTLLFGNGYNALLRGRIHFYFNRWSAQWKPTTFLDVGLVALFAETGIVGAVAHFGLLLYMLVYAFIKKRRYKDKELDFFWITLFIIPLYLLLNYLAAFLHASIFWIFVSLFYAYKKLDAQEKAAAAPAEPETPEIPEVTEFSAEKKEDVPAEAEEAEAPAEPEEAEVSAEQEEAEAPAEPEEAEAPAEPEDQAP